MLSFPEHLSLHILPYLPINYLSFSKPGDFIVIQIANNNIRCLFHYNDGGSSHKLITVLDHLSLTSHRDTQTNIFAHKLQEYKSGNKCLLSEGEVQKILDTYCQDLAKREVLEFFNPPQAIVRQISDDSLEGHAVPPEVYSPLSPHKTSFFKKSIQKPIRSINNLYGNLMCIYTHLKPEALDKSQIDLNTLVFSMDPSSTAPNISVYFHYSRALMNESMFFSMATAPSEFIPIAVKEDYKLALISQLPHIFRHASTPRSPISIADVDSYEAGPSAPFKVALLEDYAIYTAFLEEAHASSEFSIFDEQNNLPHYLHHMLEKGKKAHLAFEELDNLSFSLAHGPYFNGQHDDTVYSDDEATISDDDATVFENEEHLVSASPT